MRIKPSEIDEERERESLFGWGGPGRSGGLMTLRGAELLQRAEVVVYDALVNATLLKLAPKGAEVIFRGKRPKENAIPQEELNALAGGEGARGETAWSGWKGGDPYVFGRGGEEAEELAKAMVPFEVVPGISSAIAVPNYAGIPVTHRDHCSSFVVVTGHEDPAKPDGAVIDWEWIARAPGTKIILMGAERIGGIAETLVTARAAARDARSP